MCNVTLRNVCVNIVAVGKPITIAYSECVSVILVIWHVGGMLHIVTCNLSSCTIFFHIIP